MPCPFFEPQQPVRPPSQVGGRLPLLDEYYGLCHAGGVAVEAPESGRFRCCNHGNSKGVCPTFPARETRSCIRYQVIESANAVLKILCIEEQDYAPARWYSVEYSVLTSGLRPEPDDLCIRTQATAFARSFLAHTSPNESI